MAFNDLLKAFDINLAVFSCTPIYLNFCGNDNFCFDKSRRLGDAQSAEWARIIGYTL